MQAVDGLLEVLRTEGIDRVFGNPGTTELPFVDALDTAGVPYVLAPHEGAVVAMADGFARATRRTSFVSLHIAAGVANGLIGLLNASRSRTPMVITAGQQDRRHLIQEPMLSGDVVGLAAAATKQALEVHRADDLAVVMRRAFRLAAAPPAGPVLVSIPMDLLEDELDSPVPRRTAVDRRHVAAGVDDAVAVLRSARGLAVVAGDGVGRAGAVDELVRVCDALGATVYHQPMYDQLDFPLDHERYAGMLAPDNAAIRATLDAHDAVLFVGVRAFAPHHYSPIAAMAPDAVLVQLDDDDAQIGRTYPATVALLGDIGKTLGAIGDALGAPVPSVTPTAVPRVPATGGGDAPLTPVEAAVAVAGSLPAGAVVVEEAITTGLLVRERLRLSEPGSYHHAVGGGLGWGIGAAVGVALGRPDRPVVSLLGDGCALFGLHALWSAARLGTATTFVVFDNGEYRTLKQTTTGLRKGRPGNFPGMDLANPPVRWPELSASLGVPGLRIGSSAELAEVLSSRSSENGPLLVQVPVTSFADEQRGGRH